MKRVARRAIHTLRFSRFAQRRVGIAIAITMRIPPMVACPLGRWLFGPSSSHLLPRS